MDYQKTLLAVIGNLNEDECKFVFEILSKDTTYIEKKELFICPKDNMPIQCEPDDHYCRNHCTIRQRNSKEIIDKTKK